MNIIVDGGPAFPKHEHDPNCVHFCCYGLQDGMSLRAYAAIQLCIPNSGIDWLDAMITESQELKSNLARLSRS